MCCENFVKNILYVYDKMLTKKEVPLPHIWENKVFSSISWNICHIFKRPILVQNQIRLWEAPNLFCKSSVRIVRGYKEKREKEWYNKSGNWLLFSTEWRIQWMWQYLYTQDLSILYLQIHVWGQKLLLHCKKFTIHILFRLDSEQKSCECDVNA